MSVYAFYEVVTNAKKFIENDASSNETLSDASGYSLHKWLNYGVIGWDGVMETYFVQLESDEDDPCCWLGTTHKEIPTFAQLCEVISQIFNVKKGTFKFENVIEIDV